MAEQLDHAPGWRIGIDLGGTKIAATALAPDGREIPRLRVPTPTSYDAIVKAIARLVAEVDDWLQRQGSPDASWPVGIGHPGSTCSRTGLIRNSNSQALNGRALERDLAATLARPTRLANDANCLALAEAHDGAGAGYQVVFGVIIGTGTGGGVVVDGRLIAGHNALAGEWGHIPLPWPRYSEQPGPACYCGLQGCIETWLSGAGLARAYHGVCGDDALGVSAAEIAARSKAGESQAAAAIDRYVDRLARSLALMINVLDPHIIVLGGGLSNLPNLTANLPEQLNRWVFADRVDTPIVCAQHGDAGGVRGAAQLFDPSGR